MKNNLEIQFLCILEAYCLKSLKLIKSAFSAIELINATNRGGGETTSSSTPLSSSSMSFSPSEYS
jgi:hypothetical protein